MFYIRYLLRNLLIYQLSNCRFTREAGGYAFLYADIFMNKQEFEEMFDLTAYERVRQKYNAEGCFPHLYDKVRPEVDVFAIGKQYAEEYD